MGGVTDGLGPGVLLLSADADQGHALSQALVASGFLVNRCVTLPAMYELHASQHYGFVILHGGQHETLAAAARLRTLSPGLGIIALTPPLSSEARVQLLLCGVDSCLEEHISHHEIAAVLQALARRGAVQTAASTRPLSMLAAGMAPAPTPSEAAPEPVQLVRGWRLLEDGWVLASPDDGRLNLTGTERALLQALVQAPTQRLSREDLLNVVDVRPGAGERGRLRYVDVLICRLRRKAADRHLRLPIRAVHGWGYMFSGNE